jgi:hypothetical protein
MQNMRMMLMSGVDRSAGHKPPRPAFSLGIPLMLLAESRRKKPVIAGNGRLLTERIARTLTSLR